MASSHTQRSLKYLRDNGYIAEVVERWIPGAKVRKDLFSVIDIVACHPGTGETVGVQVCRAGDMSTRQKKAEKCKELKIWLQCNNKFMIQGWVKRKNRWQVKERPIEISNMLSKLPTD